MSAAGDLPELLRYNAWANTRVCETCAEADPRLLTMPAPGTIGTILATIAHLTRMEEAYCALLQQDSVAPMESREAFESRDVAALGRRLTELGATFQTWVERAAPEDLARRLPITWLDFEVSAREALLQVLSHSAQHRSQILSVLGGQGVEVPDLDYVLLLQQERV
jgi:uncharacterized damage-inducible protein DinB